MASESWLGYAGGFAAGIVVGVAVAWSWTNGSTVVAVLAAVLLIGVGVAFKLSVIDGRGQTGVVFAALGAVVLIVLTTTDLFGSEPIVSPAVPLFVYVYALVGGVGYVFTEIIIDGDETDGPGDDGSNDEASTQHATADGPYVWIIRVLAAVPLSAAVFLLATLLLPESQLASRAVVVETASNETITIVDGSTVSRGLENGTVVTNIEPSRRLPSDRVLAGVALLSGFFVRTTYERLNSLAVRLVGDGRRNGDDTDQPDASDQTNQPDGVDETGETDQTDQTGETGETDDRPDQTDQTGETGEIDDRPDQTDGTDQTDETGETGETGDRPDQTDQTDDQTDQTDRTDEIDDQPDQTDQPDDEASEGRTDEGPTGT